MLEYSESELRGMTWAQLTYPEDLDADVRQFQRLLAMKLIGMPWKNDLSVEAKNYPYQTGCAMRPVNRMGLSIM